MRTETVRKVYADHIYLLAVMFTLGSSTFICVSVPFRVTVHDLCMSRQMKCAIMHHSQHNLFTKRSFPIQFETAAVV